LGRQIRTEWPWPFERPKPGEEWDPTEYRKMLACKAEIRSMLEKIEISEKLSNRARGIP